METRSKRLSLIAARACTPGASAVLSCVPSLSTLLSAVEAAVSPPSASTMSTATAPASRRSRFSAGDIFIGSPSCIGLGSFMFFHKCIEFTRDALPLGESLHSSNTELCKALRCCAVCKGPTVFWVRQAFNEAAHEEGAEYVLRIDAADVVYLGLAQGAAVKNQGGCLWPGFPYGAGEFLFGNTGNEELSRDIGKAGLETLSVILY